MDAIETRGLTKRYGEVAALEALDLTVEGGELFALLGPNGSGKTTTIEILTGQLEPTSGTATVLGHDPVADPIAVRHAIGVLPEREDPPSFLTPREYLEFAGEVRAIDDLGATIDEWARKFEFEGTLDTLARDLSEGERQRVMLAQAFLHEPALVFIDEPLVNLDPIMQGKVRSHLVEYCESGNTIFLSTHFVEAAADLCTGVGIISDGTLIARRDPDALEDGEALRNYFESEVTAATAEATPEP
jgi:ABC-2 type transport system ATP-binding protein